MWAESGCGSISAYKVMIVDSIDIIDSVLDNQSIKLALIKI